MKNTKIPEFGSARLVATLKTIDGAFCEHLRQRHYAVRTKAVYRQTMIRIAHAFARQGRDISTQCRATIERRIRLLWHGEALAPQAAFRAWLMFRGRLHIPMPRSPQRDWIDGYAHFLANVRGFCASSRRAHAARASRYLIWQFGHRALRWDRVHPKDILNYASHLQRGGLRARSVIDYLSSLRQFLRFVHLRGKCPPELARAVPAISNRGQAIRHPTLTDAQRRTLLGSFNRKSADGLRDYAMTLCMIDLGLRRIEVVRLRLGHIDWERKTLAVPPAKAGRGRILPLPRHVAAALRG